jgi:dihydrofolate reductase
MGKLVVTEFVSLDGVMEDPGGSEQTPVGGWAFRFDRGAEGDEFKLAELRASDAQLLGRVTYEGFAQAWPERAGTGEFGERMNKMPKFVVSATVANPTWNNTTVLAGDLAQDVRGLKERFNGDILVAGSARLARSLLALGLVDELHLMVFPVVLGQGKRLFPAGEPPLDLTLVETRQFGSVAVLTLIPAGEAQAAPTA